MTNEELTKKYVELDERVTQHTEQIKTAFNQINDLPSQQERIEALEEAMELLLSGVTEVCGDE